MSLLRSPGAASDNLPCLSLECSAGTTMGHQGGRNKGFHTPQAGAYGHAPPPLGPYGMPQQAGQPYGYLPAGQQFRYPPAPSGQTLIQPNAHRFTPAAPWASSAELGRLQAQSVEPWAPKPPLPARPSGGRAHRMNQGATFYDRTADRVGNAFTSGNDRGARDEVADLADGIRDLDIWEADGDEGERRLATKLQQKERKTGGWYSMLKFRRTWQYQNSRLPPVMLPFKTYLPTWTLITRAAQASLDAYQHPRREARAGFAAGDPQTGTKAHLVFEQTVDDRRLITVAIRGSHRNVVDWHVNFALEPAAPVGFLDDEGNACHSGYLQVARAMIAPIAAQLRKMIQENESCRGSYLMFTGHSAGGAVASLLFMHMMSKTIDSELTTLAGVFRRIHCITFGAPPLSLLPLQVPTTGPYAKNMFLAFANEGDLVVRADWPYMRSLAKLLASPPPTTKLRLQEQMSRRNLQSTMALPLMSASAPYWPVPEASLSAAGRLVLLRETPGSKTHAIEAVQLTDEELRGVLFGDLTMHEMALYKSRVDILGFAAMAGRTPD